MELKIEYMALEKLKPYEKNARKHQEADLSTIKASISEFGMSDPIGVWGKDNIIVEGHGRYLACKELGIDNVPVIHLDHLTDEQRRAYALAHNKTAEMSEWDFDLLGGELADILDIDMSDFGFDLSEDEEEETEIIDDEIPEEVEPIAKQGDIWQLGRHRLMCGDSTSVTDVEKLMDGRKADLVFTDPPYGMKKENDGVANDNLNFDDLLDFNRQWIPLSFAMLKDNGSWYCWGIDEPLMDIYSNILKPMQKENKITFRNLITWDKGNGQGQMSEDFRMFPIADEKCLFVMCGVQNYGQQYWDKWDHIRNYMINEKNKAGLTTCKKINEIIGVSSAGGGMASHYFSPVGAQFTLPTKEVYEKIQNYCVENNIDAFKRDYEEIKRDWYETRAYFNNTHDNMNNVWHFDRTSVEEREGAGGHATPKPIALCGRAIKSSSRENENVLDVFGGSGSTLIACEQLNRSAYLMELEPKWCDVIIARWEKFTGQKAVLINGNS